MNSGEALAVCLSRSIVRGSLTIEEQIPCRSITSRTTLDWACCAWSAEGPLIGGFGPRLHCGVIGADVAGGSPDGLIGGFGPRLHCGTLDLLTL